MLLQVINNNGSILLNLLAVLFYGESRENSSGGDGCA